MIGCTCSLHPTVPPDCDPSKMGAKQRLYCSKFSLNPRLTMQLEVPVLPVFASARHSLDLYLVVLTACLQAVSGTPKVELTCRTPGTTGQVCSEARAVAPGSRRLSFSGCAGQYMSHCIPSNTPTATLDISLHTDMSYAEACCLCSPHTCDSIMPASFALAQTS